MMRKAESKGQLRNKQMNIIRMTGGLGNQMFQYALYLKLKTLGREVKLDDITEYEGRDARPLMLWIFGIEYPKATLREIDEITDGFLKLTHRIRRKLFGRKSMEYMEKDCNFDEEILKREPAYLTGYFQSEKYFKDIEPLVRDSFQFSQRMWDGISEELVGKIKFYQEQIDNTLSVSIHIRRGDYLDNAEAYGNICTDDYYRKAVAVMRERFPEGSFFVFSNEPEWTKRWIADQYGKDSGFTIIEGTDENIGYLDLYLMSRCKHHILANSSFSWWGAWLNPSADKLVIVPDRWFGNQDCADIYTEGMLKISPEGEITKQGAQNDR